MKDYCITDFQDENFKKAFKVYFAELGITIKDWDALFQEINAEKGNIAYIRIDENNEVMGFIQFRVEVLTNWFFQESVGFIREFWIKNNYRNKGFGSELLAKAEAYFLEQGIRKTILTSDTAEAFYIKHGYMKDSSYQAKNEDNVYIKIIS